MRIRRKKSKFGLFCESISIFWFSFSPLPFLFMSSFVSHQERIKGDREGIPHSIFRGALDLFTLSLPLARHVLHGVQSCETSGSTKHPRSARGNFVPILKTTRDELPMEQGVYGGCLLCHLYPLLFSFSRLSFAWNCVWHFFF